MSERSIRRDHDRRRARLRRRAQLAGASAAGASALLAGSAHAATFTVNSTADPGTGTCDVTECTLREAVAAAEVDPDADTIDFSLPAGPQTINLNASQLSVTSDLTITGPGEANLTLDAGPGAGYNDTSRILSIEGSPGGGVSVDLSGMTLTGGVAGTSGLARDGGAIASEQASLSLSQMTLTDSHATGNGGAISWDGEDANPSAPTDGSLSIEAVSISGNTTNDAGGGVYAQFGSVEITDTDITSNSAIKNTDFSPKYLESGGLGVESEDFSVSDVLIADNTVQNGDGKYMFVGGRGGGAVLSGSGSISDSTVEDNTATAAAGGLLLNDGATAVRSTIAGNAVTVDRRGGGGVLLDGASLVESTVSGNTTPAKGGGVAAVNDGGRIDNSTITGNSGLTGGGVDVEESSSLTVRNSTIAGNTASTDGGGIFVYESTDPPSVIVRNSIVADNQPANTDIDSNNSGAAIASFSLVEAPSPVAVTGDPPGSNLIGVDPQLGALADNGGPTATLLPALTSPAIDASAGSPFATDQRGLARTVDTAATNAPLSDGTDMGAVEVADATARGDDPETTITAGPSGTGNPASVTFEFSSDDPAATFECSLDGAAFTACTSPATFNGLSDGPHSFEVRAKDADGNLDTTPAVRLFNVGTPGPGPDTTAPATAITKAPTTLKVKGRTARAKVSFEGIDDLTAPGALTFECRVDTAAFKPCTSPTALKLKKGKRKIQVRAVDAAGNVDETPAKVTVKVTKKKAKG